MARCVRIRNPVRLKARRVKTDTGAVDPNSLAVAEGAASHGRKYLRVSGYGHFFEQSKGPEMAASILAMSGLSDT